MALSENQPQHHSHFTATPAFAAAAKTLLRKLGAGQAVVAEAAGLRCGTCIIDAKILDQLLAADVIAADGPRRFIINAPGLRWLERDAAARAKTSTNAGFDQQNRLMATVKLAGIAELLPINLAESPLAWLTKRRLISRLQFEAGERLRADFHLSARAPKVTMSWDAPPMGKTARGAYDSLDPTTAQLAAKRRFEAAVAAAGPGLSDVLWRVACMGEGLETTEKAMQWPVRTAKVVLGLALDRLVIFYKL